MAWTRQMTLLKTIRLVLFGINKFMYLFWTFWFWLGLVILLNVTFNNISVISWPSVLLVEENRVPGENHIPVASHRQTLSHNVLSSTPRHERRSNSQPLVVIGTDCIGNCKSNYHTISTTTSPGPLTLQDKHYILYIIGLHKIYWQTVRH